MKNTFLAAILSFIFPGVGHLYIGQKKKGIALIITLAVIYLISMVSPIISILILIIDILAIVDCLNSVKKINVDKNKNAQV